MLETSSNFDHSKHLNYVIAPEAPTTTGGMPSPENHENKKKMSLKNKLLLGGAGVALAAVAATGIGISVSAKGEKAPEATSTSAPATPEASVAPTNTTETFTVKSLEIPATSSPEQLAVAFSDRLTQYLMASANPASYKERLAYQGGTSNQFAIEHASKDAAIFNEAMFVQGFESDPNMLQYTSAWKDINASVTEDYIITAGNDPADKEPFSLSYTSTPGTEKVVSQDAGSITVQFTVIEHNNADKNRIGSQYDPGALSQNGVESIVTAKFNTVDSNYKISSLAIAIVAK